MSLRESVRAGIGKEYLIVSMLRVNRNNTCIVDSVDQKQIFPEDVRDQLFTKEEYFKKYGGAVY